jgi:hypothetical protein
MNSKSIFAPLWVLNKFNCFSQFRQSLCKFFSFCNFFFIVTSNFFAKSNFRSTWIAIAMSWTYPFKLLHYFSQNRTGISVKSEVRKKAAELLLTDQDVGVMVMAMRFMHFILDWVSVLTVTLEWLMRINYAIEKKKKKINYDMWVSVRATLTMMGLFANFLWLIGIFIKQTANT